jgi:hypothetical protein
MDEDAQKEQFSNAYVRAVAATAGYTVYKPEVDDDSVDWVIAARGGGGTTRSPRVELQLKCTSQRHALKEDHIALRIKQKNYEDLRHEDYQVPRILVVVVVPEGVDNWLGQTRSFLAIRNCGYWISLRGKPARAEDKVTVHLPHSNIFSVIGVRSMMSRVARGGLP